MSSSVVVAPTKFPGAFVPGITNILKIELSIAQVTSLFSAPITLFPATPGYAHVIPMFHVMRAGDPYASQPGNITLTYTSGAMTLATIAAATTLLITQPASATPGILYSPAYAGQGTFTGLALNIGGRAITIQAAAGNPTVDGNNPGSSLIFTFKYELWPVIAANVGSY